jgi:hypothetical protein
MKTIFKRLTIVSIMIAIALLSSLFGFSQKRLPDGTIVYPDGRKQLPNGTVLNPNGTIQKRSPVSVLFPNRTTVPTQKRSPVSVLFPKRTPVPSPNPTIPRRETHPAGWIPPGQAKKIYGTKSARPFAPGQQKKWNHGNGNGKGNWKQDREDNDERKGEGNVRGHNERDDD